MQRLFLAALCATANALPLPGTSQVNFFADIKTDGAFRNADLSAVAAALADTMPGAEVQVGTRKPSPAASGSSQHQSTVYHLVQLRLQRNQRPADHPCHRSKRSLGARHRSDRCCECRGKLSWVFRHSCYSNPRRSCRYFHGANDCGHHTAGSHRPYSLPL